MATTGGGNFASRCKLKVIVVGAGTAGLSTAWMLTKAGHDATVLERKNTLNMGGGDIQVSPNAVRVLRRLGLEERLKAVTTAKTHVVVRGWRDMDILNTAPLGGGVPIPSRMVRRDDLIQAVYDIAVDAGAKILFERYVVEVDENKPSVTLSDGTVMEADLIVGADGVKSTTRHLLFPDRNTDPITTDQVCFHFNIPYSLMSKDPDLLSIYNEGRETVAIAQGPYRYIVGWTLDSPRHEYFCITSEVKYDQPAGITSWDADARYLEEVRALFKEWAGPWRKLLDVATDCAKWRIVDGVKGADWVSKSGKVVLIGDAIHTMPPHAAQGCSQGFEDSAALGTFLSSLPSPSHLPQYLTAFAELRSHRTSKIQQTSRASLLALTMPDGPAQEARDAMWRDRRTDESIVEAWNRTTIDEDASIADPSFMKWVQGYDVVEMARKKVAELESGM